MPFWPPRFESEANLSKNSRPGNLAGVFIWENFNNRNFYKGNRSEVRSRKPGQQREAKGACLQANEDMKTISAIFHHCNHYN